MVQCVWMLSRCHLGMGPNPGSAAHPSYVPRPQFPWAPLCKGNDGSIPCWPSGRTAGTVVGVVAKVTSVSSGLVVPRTLRLTPDSDGNDLQHSLRAQDPGASCGRHTVLYQKSKVNSAHVRQATEMSSGKGSCKAQLGENLLQEALRPSAGLWLFFVSSTSSLRAHSLALEWVLCVHVCLSTTLHRVKTFVDSFVHLLSSLCEPHITIQALNGPRKLTRCQILGKERATHGCNGCRSSRQQQGHRRGLKREPNTAEVAPAGGGVLVSSPQPIKHSFNKRLWCTCSEASPVAGGSECREPQPQMSPENGLLQQDTGMKSGNSQGSPRFQ